MFSGYIVKFFKMQSMIQVAEIADIGRKRLATVFRNVLYDRIIYRGIRTISEITCPSVEHLCDS